MSSDDLAILTQAIPEVLRRQLEEEIVFGRLEPLARLTEEEVAARYGVSRSPVREALRLLEGDGLVHRAARRGIWVAPLSLRDFDEIYACRIPLEGLAAAGAAASGTAQDKAALLDLLPGLWRAYEARDARAFFEVDIQASGLIYAMAGNATLSRLIASLGKQALRYRFFAYAREPKMLEMVAPGSRRLWSSIAEGDAEGARAGTESLIREIWQIMRAIIREHFGAA